MRRSLIYAYACVLEATEASFELWGMQGRQACPGAQRWAAGRGEGGMVTQRGSVFSSKAVSRAAEGHPVAASGARHILTVQTTGTEHDFSTSCLSFHRVCGINRAAAATITPFNSDTQTLLHLLLSATQRGSARGGPIFAH